eukprot:scaffold63135_cov55-Phaeocystis_antarctica.AAC.2
MKKGGKAKLTIPPAIAYGPGGSPPHVESRPDVAWVPEPPNRLVGRRPDVAWVPEWRARAAHACGSLAAAWGSLGQPEACSDAERGEASGEPASWPICKPIRLGLDTGSPPAIPPEATLVFVVELLDFQGPSALDQLAMSEK